MFITRLIPGVLIPSSSRIGEEKIKFVLCLHKPHSLLVLVYEIL